MELRTEFKRRLRTSPNWLSIIEEWEQEAEQIASTEARSERFVAIGEVCEELLLRRDKAMADYQRAFRLHPQNLRALVRAREIYRLSGNFDMVTKLLDVELKALPLNDIPGRARAAAALAMAYLREGRLALAKPLLEESSKLVPDPEVLDAVEVIRVFEAQGIGGVADELAKAQESSGAEAARHAMVAAWLVRLANGIRPAGAPGSRGITDERYEQALRLALFNRPLLEIGNELLDELLVEQQRWKELEELHQFRASSVRDGAERASLFRRFADEWAIRFHDRDRSAHFYFRALESVYRGGDMEAFPGHIAAFAYVREIYGARGDWMPLVELVDKGLSGRLKSDDELLLSVEGAVLAWKHVGDLERARTLFARAAAIDPTVPELQEFMASGGVDAAGGADVAAVAGTSTAHVESAPQTVEPEPKAVEPSTKAAKPANGAAHTNGSSGIHNVVDATSSAGSSSADDFAKSALDTAELEELAGAVPGAVPGDAIESVSSSMMQEEAALTTSSTKSKEPAKRDSAKGDAAKLETLSREPSTSKIAAEPKASAPAPKVAPPPPPVAASALPSLEDEVIPEANRPALEAARALVGQSIERAIDAYRKLLVQAPTVRTVRHELGALYRQAERWNALVELLKEEADKILVDHPAERVRVLFELVALYKDRLRLDVMVINVYNQILQIDPSHQDALDALAQQYESMKRWPDLIGLLQKKAKVVDDPEERVGLLLRVASLFVEKFSNAAEAIKAYEAVLETDPANALAIGYLKDMYTKRRDWEKLIAVHLKEVDELPASTDVAERASRLLEIAKLASERLKKPSVSIDLWQRVLEADDRNMEALVELEKLYKQEKRWDELAAVCERQVELFDDAPRKIATLQTLGVLYGEKLEDPTRAGRAWRLLLELEPANRRAQDAIKKIYLTNRAWDELEQFYVSQGKVDEYVRVLERQVDVEDESVKLELQLRIGAQYRDKLEKPDRASRAFEAALKLDPRSARVAEALIPLYETGNDPRKLAGVLEVQLDHTTDSPTRLERIRRLAELSEQSLREPKSAFAWYLKAFAQEPQIEWTRAEAERLAASTSGWGELVAAYEAAVPKVAEPQEALPLYQTIARAYEGELGQLDRAIATNKRLLELSADGVASASADAVAALERLYRQTERWSELLAIYDKQIELATGVDAASERRSVRYKIAELHEAQPDGVEQAIATYQAILSEKDDEIRALGALERIYTTTQNWGELAPIISRSLALVEGADPVATVELKLRLGQLREGSLGDVEGAIECYREILEVDGEHVGAREALERRLDDDKHKLAAALLLESGYERRGEWSELIRVLEIELSCESERSARVALLLRIGELYAEKIGDGAKAFDAYARCFRDDPRVDRARQEIDRLAAIQDNWADVVALYESAVGSGTATTPIKDDLEPALVHELVIKLAQVNDEKLERFDRAIEYYRRALVLEPEDPIALDALEKLLTQGEQWTELLEIYRRKVELASRAEERQQHLFRIAYLWEELLGNVDEAIGTYREVLGIDDRNTAALRALDRLYQVKEAWHELADNLSRQLSLTSERPEEIELLLRLAALREQKLSEISAAIDTYRRVLELDAENDAATVALQRLLADPEHELTIAQLLEPIYLAHHQAKGDWHRLADIYEIMVRHALDPSRKVELLLSIGELYEESGKSPADAFTHYARALREDPSSFEPQARIERLGRELDRMVDVVELYRSIVEQVTDEELKVAFNMKVAHFCEHALGQLDEAAGAYEQVLLLDPRRREAIDALEQIYLRQQAYPQLVDVALRKAGVVEAIPEKKELLFKAAQIYEDVLEDLEHAIEVYRQILALDDVDRGAIEALERLYVRLERWTALRDIYIKKAELASSPAEKKQMYFVLGQVHDRELHDAAGAIEVYQSILDLDANDFEAIQALDRLFGQEKRWYDLLAILGREVELAHSPGETAAIKHRIGRLWEAELGDLSRAVESYREVLQLEPTHEPTRAALDAILRGEAEPALAAEVLEPIFERACEWERLIEVYEVMVRFADDPARRIELLHTIAGLCERDLDQPERAFEAVARALREDSSNERTLSEIERLAGTTHRWPQLAELYEAELGKLIDSNRQIETLLRLARVYEDELAEPEKAIIAYRRVLAIEPEHREVLAALDRLYALTSQWPELADILRKEVRLAGSDDALIGLQFRLGQLYEKSLRDLPQSIDVYREILQARPDHGPTRTALELLFSEAADDEQGGKGQGRAQTQRIIGAILEPLYQTDEQWERLARLYEAQLEWLVDPAERQSLWQRLAELVEQKLGNPAAAMVWWGSALREDPSAELADAELERLAAVTGDWNKMVEVYTAILDEREETELRKRIYLRLARLYELELRERERAVETYLRALDIDENDDVALAALDRLYTDLGMWSELAMILRRRLRQTTATDDIIELQHRLGALYTDALDEPERAVNAYGAVLEQDSRNRGALDALERIYFRGEQWDKLYDIYAKMVDVTSDNDELAEVYARMAKLASDALDDLAKAQDLWQGVLELRKEEPRALEQLGMLYERTGGYQELADILQRRVRFSDNQAEQARIYKQLGRVYQQHLGRERDALDAWLAAVERDRSDAESLYAVAGLYRSSQAWDELAGTLNELIDLGATTMEERELIELYAQLGELQGEILMRPREAIAAWRKVLELDDHDFRALTALETLYTREARWEECIDILKRRAAAVAATQGTQGASPAVGHASQVDILLQAAAIYEEKLDDQRQAGLLYEEILRIDSTNAAASVELERIYRESSRWEPLIELLLHRVEYLESLQQRIETLQSVAKIYEGELGQPDLAFVALQAAFKLDYANDATARELERLASSTGKWSELLTEYTEVVQTLPDRAAAADLWVKIGCWYGNELGHVDYAIASVQQALNIDADHAGALSALAEFYRKTRRWPELASVLARHAEVEEDNLKRADILLTLGDAWERQLGDMNQAIAAYRQALELNPAMLPAIEALQRLYTLNSLWTELIDVLSRKAAIVDNTEEVIRLKSEIGQLYDMRLGDARHAIEAYKDILTVDPQHLPSLQALEGLYERAGMTEEYLDILEQQLDVSGTDDERISLYQRMAVAWEEQFRKPERAWECFEKILDIDPGEEQAFASLERLYRQERRWEELVDTYRRHINATSNTKLRIQLYSSMGQVYDAELRSPERAIEAYTDVLGFDGDHVDALRQLARLYEGIEDWQRAVDSMNRIIELAGRGPEQVELDWRIGKVLDERLSDEDGAEDRFLRSITSDETYVPAMTALTALYQRRGDWLKAAQMMVRAEPNVTSPLEKTRLLTESGHIYMARLEDPARASELYARALEIDPEYVEAGQPLSEIYLVNGRYADLEPILDMLVRKADRREPRELLTLYYNLGRTADELGKAEKALRYYKAAYELDSTHLPTLLGRAALLFKQEQWDAAFKLYQTVLVHHRETQDQQDIVEIFHRLGQIKRQLGERKKALNMFEKALELDAYHVSTLQAIIELQTQQNEWEAVVHAKRALLVNSDEEERIRQLTDIGDIYHERLNNPPKAISAYLEALEIRPGHHAVLQKLLDLYTATEQWKKSVDVLTRFAELEENPKHRAKYLYSAAVISREKIKALDEALDFFNGALDADPELLKAFEAIDRLCTTRKDWKLLERSYRRMIKRMPTEAGVKDELKTTLWHNLGEIYRTRMKDYQSAVAAFEVAAQLDPQSMQRHEILAELYVLAGPDNLEKAAGEHQLLIKHSPFATESYKALRRIYMDMGQYDQAWCVAAALMFLQKADAEEQGYFEQYKPRGFTRAKQRLTEDMWLRNVFHADEDRTVGAVFASLWQSVALLKAQPLKAFGLKRKEKRDLATDQLLFSKVFNYVNQVVNVPQPELYLRPEQPFGLQLANAQEKNQLLPSFVVGSDLLQGRPEKELAFAIAKNLSYLRPEHYLRIAVPTVSELKITFLAALKIVNPAIPVKGDSALVEQYVQAIRKTIQPTALEQLAIVVNRHLALKVEVDLHRWCSAVDLTLQRAGLILCNDLEVAAKMVSTEPAVMGGAQPKEKLKELLLYAVSPEYFRVRQHLGLTIG